MTSFSSVLSLKGTTLVVLIAIKLGQTVDGYFLWAFSNLNNS